MERDGRPLDLDAAAGAMLSYRDAGSTASTCRPLWQRRGHRGRFLALTKARPPGPAGGTRATVFTKWCPTPQEMTAGRSAPGSSAASTGSACRQSICCSSIGGISKHSAISTRCASGHAAPGGRHLRLGVTNFGHRSPAAAGQERHPIVSNQVCFSLLDRRAAERMSEFLPDGTASGCRLGPWRRPAHRTLAGVEPRRPSSPTEQDEVQALVDAIGGWAVLQEILAALSRVATKHGASIAMSPPAGCSISRRSPRHRRGAAGEREPSRRQSRNLLHRARR